MTVVPVHPRENIGRGLLRKILRDAEITPEEFSKLA
ncbi:MAG: type II toxin-antitoxin system HicA family toxin [Euryarchaeota archaeon]|nr:type II toxin-antitoxin system HicA family toxin [Euryarchaeota archaeon]